MNPRCCAHSTAARIGGFFFDHGGEIMKFWRNDPFVSPTPEGNLKIAGGDVVFFGKERDRAIITFGPMMRSRALAECFERFCCRAIDLLNDDELRSEINSFREAAHNGELMNCPRCGTLHHIDWLHDCSSTTKACFECSRFFCESCDTFREDVFDHQCKDCRI